MVYLSLKVGGNIDSGGYRFRNILYYFRKVVQFHCEERGKENSLASPSSDLDS